MTVDPGTETDALDAEPVHYAECVDQVGAALARDGALGVILIDGAPLARIERIYGVQAHRKATDMLRSLVREACRQDLSEHDLVVGGSSSPSSLPARSEPDSKVYWPGMMKRSSGAMPLALRAAR